MKGNENIAALLMPIVNVRSQYRLANGNTKI